MTRPFIHTGILGLDEILGGVRGTDGRVQGRLQSERILIVGPPGSGKTILALALIYKALSMGKESDHGLFLTTEQTADYLLDSVTGLFMKELPAYTKHPSRLALEDFPAINPLGGVRRAPHIVADSLITHLREVVWERPITPRHIVLDGLTAMQMVLRSQAEARRLTQLLIGTLSFPRNRLDLLVVTAEAHAGFTSRNYSEHLHDSFDEFLFDTVIYLDVVETPADRRLRTIEIPKSRGRHARTGRHTFSIVSDTGLDSLIHSPTAREDIQVYDTPVIIFPREPRGERTTNIERKVTIPSPEYLHTGINGLDALLDRQHRGLLQRSTTLLVGGPGTGSSLVGLRYLVQGLTEKPTYPVLLLSFGRSWENFALLAHAFPWFQEALKRSADALHFLYYRPVNLDQNRLFYELRTEIETHKIDRVFIDSLSSLTLVDSDTDASSDFLVTLIGLLKEMRCTAMLSYATSQPPAPFAAPGRFLPSLVDNIFVLRNILTDSHEMRKTLSILKARGTEVAQQEASFSIGEDLSVDPLDSTP